MSSKSRIGFIAAIAMTVAAGAGGGQFAFAKQPPTPSGNLNLRIQGYELVTQNSSSVRVDIDGIGQLISDTDGNISGAETFTAVNPALPSGSSSEDVCNGTVSGSITAPGGSFGSGEGSFTLSLNYAPSVQSTGAFCIPSTTTLLCNRTLLHVQFADDLDAGQYHCVVTGVMAGNGSNATINAALMNAHVDSVRGSNAPNN